MIPTDPLFDRQRHLSNDTGLDLHILQAWDDYSGAGVRVAVMDDGVQGSHPDLDGNYRFDLDFDARDNDKDAAPVDLGLGTVGDNHGTPVAGVIGMDANNGVGGVGVAWGCDLTGLRVGHGSEGGLQQDEACFARFNRFDVVNNSWQNPSAYVYNFEDPFFSNLSNELFYAVQNGRGRLGTNIVFISSNFREDGFDTNFSNLTNSRFITTVAAINFDGAYSSYSTPGESILVSAFGTEGTSVDDGIVTTDRTGDAGRFETDYLFDNGTSYAAPQVSGVVALMLEANPGLGYRDVQNILAYSARMVNPSYVNDQTGEAGWRFNTSAQWNGGGLHFSRDYGFGLVDATAAVRLAEHWTAQSTYASGEVGSFDGAGGLVIRDHRTITTDITAPAGLRLETVEVLVNITHSHLGDLKVELIGPSGQVSLLAPANPSVGEDQDELHFRYTARRHLDEDAGGTWTLRITDNADDNQGVLNNWTLVLNGDTDNDDIYVFTDEYGSRTTAPGARNLVSDGDGGADTLNAAAVPTASRIDLSGGASRIDGRALTIADRTIENAIGGDGGDTVIGNTLKNRLLGVRGDDILDGKKGNDRLEGSEGNDWLYGRLGHDLLRGGSGRDRLSGEDGRDLLRGGVGGDRLTSGEGNDQLIGGSGRDFLIGGLGRDLLIGGLGRDLLIGGADADRFRFTTPEDSRPGLMQRDHIRDFEPGLDRIDLSAIDARPDQAGDQDFTWLGASDFTGSGGELRFRQFFGATVVSADLDGDARAEFRLELDSLVALTEANFLL